MIAFAWCKWCPSRMGSDSSRLSAACETLNPAWSPWWAWTTSAGHGSVVGGGRSGSCGGMRWWGDMDPDRRSWEMGVLFRRLTRAEIKWSQITVNPNPEHSFHLRTDSFRRSITVDIASVVSSVLSVSTKVFVTTRGVPTFQGGSRDQHPHHKDGRDY